MDIQQIHALMDKGSLPGTDRNYEFKETHISWLILSSDYVFKIKRPVKFSFLDFSTLEKRKFYCHQELRLNRRLAPEMYLNVLPLYSGMLQDTTNGKKNEIIDYAVQMKRMNNEKEMDNMLESDKVTPGHINKLAGTIASFHKQVDTIKKTFDTENLQELYADINSVISYITEKEGSKWADKINDCIEKSNNFLQHNKEFLISRNLNGYRKDCHGDLNSHNIFLYDDPVIFDCIEFNEEFRQIDILNDIAFLCVDLDFFNKKDLRKQFYQKYFRYSGIDDMPDSRRLFMYYMSYRANIRAKVTLISARKKNSSGNGTEIKDAKKYIDLMVKYSAQF